MCLLLLLLLERTSLDIVVAIHLLPLDTFTCVHYMSILSSLEMASFESKETPAYFS